MRRIVLIIHNVRSCHNVGSLLRTSEGLGVEKVYLTGYSPYPQMKIDERLPHIAASATKQISKTALGAEELVAWQHRDLIEPLLADLRADGFQIVALEQTAHAISLPDYRVPPRLALIVGREVEGIETEVLALIDTAVEIPMAGQKESYNVAAAAAMALYHCCIAHPTQTPRTPGSF